MTSHTTFIPGSDRGPFSYLLAEIANSPVKKQRAGAFRRLARSLTELRLVPGEHSAITYIGIACNSAGETGLLVVQHLADEESRLGVENA